MYINKVHSRLERGRHSGVNNSREGEVECSRGEAAFFKGQSRPSRDTGSGRAFQTEGIGSAKAVSVFGEDSVSTELPGPL